MTATLRHRLLHLTGWLYLLLSVVAAPALHAAGSGPLEPVDTSSPRATLNSLLTNVDKVLTVLNGEYRHAPSRELASRSVVPVERALATLDLSETPPATRVESGLDAGTYLYEVLSRLELPQPKDIPGKTAVSGPNPLLRWTVPHTEITIARVDKGPQTGQYLFTAESVARAGMFYAKIRDLPYLRPVPLEHPAELRKYLPGWMISIDSIERLPAWTRQVLFGQAVWKWGAFAVLLLIILGLLKFIHTLAHRRPSDKPVQRYLQQLVLPVAIIVLMGPAAYLLTEQINFIGTMARGVNLVTGAIAYLSATWAGWIGSLLTAELILLSPRISADSLDAQLLRLSARIIGIVLGITMIFYGANQVGIPLVGVLAGVGVGGLAIALAAQDSLKNLLGSLMIFMDQPYKPGERIVVQGHDGFVEQIGLRSTRIRMLNGALTTIPNEKMASADIENIGRRQFIRRQTRLRLAYDTPAEKVQRALEILRQILDNHEGMREELPPRIFFDEFNPDSLNILVSYWYHPPKRWESLAFDEQVNMAIMRRFAAEGIRLVPPASTTRLVRDSLQPAPPGAVRQEPG
jgi:MscS family membrane protein